MGAMNDMQHSWKYFKLDKGMNQLNRTDWQTDTSISSPVLCFEFEGLFLVFLDRRRCWLSLSDLMQVESHDTIQ